jgi:hypothetical protein
LTTATKLTDRDAGAVTVRLRPPDERRTGYLDLTAGYDGARRIAHHPGDLAGLGGQDCGEQNEHDAEGTDTSTHRPDLPGETTIGSDPNVRETDPAWQGPCLQAGTRMLPLSLRLVR